MTAITYRRDLGEISNIPDMMRTARRWLVWRAVPVEGKKKPRKVPYYVSGAPRSGHLDTDQDRAQLASLDDAIQVFSTGTYTGIGFALGPDGTGNHWQGIDLDNINTRPELRVLSDDLPGYTETSPSGSGTHAIGYGRAFVTLGSNASGIEAYSAGRYFTVTANNAGLHNPICLADFVENVLTPQHGRHTPVGPQKTDVFVSPQTLADLRSALASMRSDDRDLWVANGQRLKRLGEPGRALWIEWSQQSDKFDPAEAARAWDSFTADRTSYQAIFAEAKRHGWLNPRSNQMAMPRSELEECAGLTEVSLSDIMNAKPAPASFVISPIAPRREVTLLGGHGGIGKSMLALTWAAHAASTQQWGPFRIEPCKVVYISLEDEGQIVRHRLRQIIDDCDLDSETVLENLRIFDGSNIEGALMVESVVHGVARLLETPTMTEVEAAAAGAGLLIIDNASDAYGGNENVRVQVRSFMRRLKKIALSNNAACILLTHVDKLSAKFGGKDNSYSGSTGWHNSARSRVALVIVDGVIELVHEKANLGPRAKSIHLRRNENGVLFPLSADAVRAAADMTARVDAESVLNTMRGLIDRGQSIPTSETGPNTTYRMLSSAPELGAQFKGQGGKRRAKAAVQVLESDGHIRREMLKDDYGKARQRWVLTQLAPSGPP